MPLPVWIALSVLLLAVTGGAVYVFVRVRALWRAFKGFGSALEAAVRDLTGSLEGLAAKAQEAGAEKPRLDASLEHLRRTLAHVAVLRAAVQDVRDSFGRLTAVYPRK